VHQLNHLPATVHDLPKFGLVLLELLCARFLP